MTNTKIRVYGKYALGAALLGTLFGVTAVPAGAADQLSLALATEAATAAVAACEASGYRVSAAVVDASGQLKAFAKGDGSTPHTQHSSFRKAYTVVTMGPIFGFSSLGAFQQKLQGNPNAAALASLPDILLLAGAVAVERDGQLIAAIGVGGAPGGEKDEACAAAALESIEDRL